MKALRCPMRAPGYGVYLMRQGAIHRTQKPQTGGSVPGRTKPKFATHLADVICAWYWHEKALVLPLCVLLSRRTQGNRADTENQQRADDEVCFADLQATLSLYDTLLLLGCGAI